MDNLNNIPNSGNWGDAASKLNDNFNKVKQAVTTVENVSKNNKGYFTSLSALNTAFPSPKTGQTAYVYGTESSTKYYIYNAVNGAWVASSVEAPAVGVNIAEYTKSGGSSKTTKQVEDEIVQLAGDVDEVDNLSRTTLNSIALPIYDGTNEDNEFSRLIGPFTTGYTPSSYTSLTRENVNGYLELSFKSTANEGISYSTDKKINFSKLNSIEMDMEMGGVGTTANLRTRINYGLYKTTNSYTNSVNIIHIAGQYSRRKILIDVSGVEGEHYLQIHANNTSTSIDTYPVLKVYGIKLIEKPRQIIKENQFDFAMGFNFEYSMLDKVVVSDSKGVIKLPEIFRILDGHGNLHSFDNVPPISGIPTQYLSGAPQETSIGFLIANLITKEVRNIRYHDWGLISNDWVTLAVLKRNTASTTSAGKMQLHTNMSWEYDDGRDSLSGNVVSRNRDIQDYVHNAIAYRLLNSLPKKRFNFLHFTDNHGDLKRTSNVINYLNVFPHIDMAINTGDMLAGNFTHSKAVITQMTESDKPILPVVGNHDVGNSTEIALCGTHQEVYDVLIKPFNDNGWINSLGKNYWHKDFPEHKIRIISLYEYDEPMDVDPVDATKYRIWRGVRVYSQEQIDWLVDLLYNMPTDYHLIMLVHQTQTEFGSSVTINNYWNSYSTTVGDPQNLIVGDIVPEIINAWQSGTMINKAFSFKWEGSYLTPLNVNVDFSTRGQGVFVGYFQGHHHNDIIGTLTDYPIQNVFSCVQTYINTSELTSRMIRTPDTRSEDAFNVVTIDTESRKVFIVRVGANVTIDLDERKYITVDY